MGKKINWHVHSDDTIDIWIEENGNGVDHLPEDLLNSRPLLRQLREALNKIDLSGE